MDSGRRLVALIAMVVIVGAITIVFWTAWANRFDPVVWKLVVGNFAAIGGLPFAAITAFVVVALFRQAEQPIEFDGLGFKFRGAAGEIVLWIFCFLAVTGAIHLLWR